MVNRPIEQIKCLEKANSVVRKMFLKLLYYAQNRLNKKQLNDSLNVEQLEWDSFKNTDSLLVVTIAFNNEDIIEKQIKLVAKHLLEDNYIHLIADNSNVKHIAARIKQICYRYNVPYVKLPHSFIINKIGPSYSHGAAANWIYSNIVKVNNPTYFGFIDHDLFLKSSFSITPHLKEERYYGATVERGNAWYLWMGLAFFTTSALVNKNVNFLPSHYEHIYLDSGGSNWYSIYKDLPKLNRHFKRQVYPLCYNGQVIERGYELLDSVWIHGINGSNWNKEWKREADYFDKIIAITVKSSVHHPHHSKVKELY